MEINKTCTCGLKKKKSCPNCSRIKMVILLKHKYRDLKLPSLNGGKRINPVWYNYLSKNRKTDNNLFNTMYRRFNNSVYVGKVNKINFYNNATGELLISIKLN